MTITKLLLAGIFAFAATTGAYAESCCEKAKAAGKKCEAHPCCKKASAEGKMCPKCNPPPKVDEKK